MDNPTYTSLIERMQRLSLQGAIKPQTVANRVAALRASFSTRLKAYSEHLLQVGKTPRNVSNSLAAIRPWRELVVAMDTERALSGESLPPFGQAVRSLLKDFPVTRIAKQTGVPAHTIYGWLAGKKPRLSNLKYISRIETFFGVPQGELALLAGLSKGGYVPVTVGPAAQVPYRSWLAETTAKAFYIKPPPDSPLRSQWREFMQYKTGFTRDLRRSARGVWRLSPVEFRTYRDERWFEFLNGVEVPTAKFAWTKTASYLGWLSLPEEEGGAGIPLADLQTLAWFAVPERVEQYMKWRIERSGGRYNGTISEMLVMTKSLTDPETGYLTQLPKFIATLPSEFAGGDWAKMCEQTFRLARFWLSQNFSTRETTRDPRTPLAPVLELVNPMDAIVDMVQRMRASRPIGCSPRREAMWSRDLVLIKLLVSNPLRRRNVAMLTWRSDNTGQLYQRSDGSWWIRIPKKHFKNAKGAAGDQEYDMPVQEMCWTDLERYLKDFRPLLLNAPTDFVFVAGSYPAEGRRSSKLPWENVSTRVEALTKRYLWRCPGIGIHAFRHLVATSVIKASGMADFKTAALILNDRLSTVEKHYAHLKSADGAQRMNELLGSSFKRM